MDKLKLNKTKPGVNLVKLFSALDVGMLVYASAITLITKQLNIWAKQILGYVLSVFVLPG
jgi:hypothetical protein